MQDYWAPHVTVAAVIERDGKFLMVEERDETGRRVINQPAGHLEPQELLMEAVVREVREETALLFHPQGIVGIYQWSRQDGSDSFLRFCFHGDVTPIEPRPARDAVILDTHWLDSEQLRQQAERHRSPLVQRCVADYLDGTRLPIDALKHCPEPAPS